MEVVGQTRRYRTSERAVLAILQQFHNIVCDVRNSLNEKFKSIDILERISYITLTHAFAYMGTISYTYHYAVVWMVNKQGEIISYSLCQIY